MLEPYPRRERPAPRAPRRSASLLFATFLLFGLPAALCAQLVTTAADSGAGSLRAALSSATPGGEVRFSSSTDGATIVLASPVTIPASVKLTGNGADRTTVTGQLLVSDQTLITDLTLAGNTAVRGAAIDFAGDRLELRRVTLRDNVATGDLATEGGGAIAAAGGTVYAEDCTFLRNAATGASGSGGAVLLNDLGTLTALRCTFASNSASRAGGAVEHAAGASSMAYFQDCTFDANTTGNAPGNGGAVHVTGPGNVKVLRGEASGNTAAAEGGAFWNGAGEMHLQDVLIAGNVASGADADQGGGGVYNLAGRLLITGSTVIRDNRADGASGSGGGILVDDGASLEAYNTRISGNSASRAGGGIEDNSGASTTLKLGNVVLEANATGAAPGNGGGLHVTGPGNVELHGGVVSGNTAAAEGGGLWNGGGTMLVLGTVVTGNVASGADADQGGGGIFNLGGDLVVDNGASITANVADGASGSGGGILSTGGTVRVTRSVIADNTSSRAGGGIEVNRDAGTGLTLFEVTLRGNATGAAPGNGGGVHITGPADSEIYRSTVTANTAASEGGGLWNGSGRMYIDGGSVSDNVASGDDADMGGGGIFNNGGTVVAVGGLSVSGNVADGTSGSGGGFLNVAGGAAEFYGTSFSDNTANRAGGAVEHAPGDASMLQLWNVTAVENFAGSNPGNGGAVHVTGIGGVTVVGGSYARNVAASEGGGLWNNAGVMSIRDASIADNEARGDEADMGGGGLFNIGGTLTIANTAVNGNRATGAAGSGGGVLNTGDGRFVAEGSFVTGNSAVRAGGGIESATGRVGRVELSDTNLDDNVTGSAPGNGGGLHVSGATAVVIAGGTVSNNTAASEGGGLWNGDGTMNVTGTRITGNRAGGDAADQGGGGIYNLSGNVTVVDARISGNVADGASGSGGGILNDAGGQVGLTRVIVDGNSASRAGGGIEDNSGERAGMALSMTIRDSEIVNNITGAAPGNGGGVHVTGAGDLEITGTLVRDNVAASEGGGLWNGSGRMFVRESSILGNRADGPTVAMGGGGGLFNNGGQVDVSRSTIAGNTITGAMAIGGGVHNAGGTVDIVYSTISGNASAFNAGGIANAGTMTVTGSTVAMNSSANFGGGIGQAPGATTLTLRSSIVALNTAPNRGPDVDVAAGAYVSGGYNLVGRDDAGVFPASATDVEGSAASPVDPVLGPLQDNGGPTMTHALLCGSPAIDSGDPALTGPDQRGEPLLGLPDMGAFELQQSCRPALRAPTAELSTALDAPAVYPSHPRRGDRVFVASSEETGLGLDDALYVVDAYGRVATTVLPADVAAGIATASLRPGGYLVHAGDGALIGRFVISE